MAEYKSSYTGAQIDSAVSKAHTHSGNITNSGTLQTTDITIGDGDKLVVTDASDNNKVARASVYFNGSTMTKALTQKGTFETFARPSDLPTTMVASGTGHAGGLVPDPPETAGTLKYLREDGTWAEPENCGTIDYTVGQTSLADLDATLVSNALRKTAQILSAAEKAQVKTNLGITDIGDGGTATGIMVAQSNTSYTTAQIRNIVLSTQEPTSSDGNNGDIWIVYG